MKTLINLNDLSKLGFNLGLILPHRIKMLQKANSKLEDIHMSTQIFTLLPLVKSIKYTEHEDVHPGMCNIYSQKIHTS